MEEVQSLGELLTTVGIPALFCLIFMYACFKLIPDWIKVWRETKETERKRADEDQKSMQEYYSQRNKSYEQQMDIMNKQAEQQNQLIGQATQVIARSNEVIAANTEVVKQNSAMHEKVLGGLSANLEATQGIAASLHDQGKLNDKIYNNLTRLLERTSI